MGKGWSRGLTKETHTSIQRIAEARGQIDNFRLWREQMKKEGKIKSKYPPLEKDGDLAELIGVTLGDGHIGKFPRCECLRITANADNKGFVRRYASLIESVFGKVPTVSKVKNAKAMTITIYERYISNRLRIPCGSRHDLKYVLPQWINRNRNHTLRFLRGLYEAEGSYNVHLPTYTHKFQFANVNPALLNLVFKLVSGLGFHPHMSPRQVQVSRKSEVQNLKNLLEFRRY